MLLKCAPTKQASSKLILQDAQCAHGMQFNCKQLPHWAPTVGVRGSVKSKDKGTLSGLFRDFAGSPRLQRRTLVGIGQTKDPPTNAKALNRNRLETKSLYLSTGNPGPKGTRLLKL